MVSNHLNMWYSLTTDRASLTKLKRHILLNIALIVLNKRLSISRNK